MFRCTVIASAAIALASALVPAPAPAQPPAAPVSRATPPDPLDPRATVPDAEAPSALRRHRPATTPEPGGWREANDAVARIGGWRTYLREARPPDTAGSAPSGAAPAAATPSPEPRHGRH